MNSLREGGRRRSLGLRSVHPALVPILLLLHSVVLLSFSFSLGILSQRIQYLKVRGTVFYWHRSFAIGRGPNNAVSRGRLSMRSIGAFISLHPQAQQVDLR